MLVQCAEEEIARSIVGLASRAPKSATGAQ